MQRSTVLRNARLLRSRATRPNVYYADAGGKRFQSSAASAKTHQSHLAAGVAGGVAAFAMLYGWYHFSGTKQVVSSAKSALDTAQQAKDKIVQATPNTDVALKFLRSTAKSYASAIPGAAPMIDTTFDQLDSLAKTHGEQLTQVVTESYEKLQDTLSKADGKDAGEAVLAVVNDAVGKLKELGGKIDTDVISPFLEKNPKLKEALEGSQDQLKEILDKQGPEAKKIRDDTYKQLSALVAAGLNGETIQKAVSLIQEKSQQVSKLAASTGSDAWKAASENAQPLLQKLPDVKKMLDEQLPKVQGVVGEEGSQKIKELYEKLAELGKDANKKDAGELAKEAQKLVQDSFGNVTKLIGSASAGSSSGQGLKEMALSHLDKVPGVKDLPELEAIKEIFQKKGKDAEKLADATYSDIKEVLKKRLEEAKKIGNDAKEEASKSKK